jgi:hypothetical protein
MRHGVEARLWAMDRALAAAARKAGGGVAVSASTRFQLQVTIGFNPFETLTPTHG